MRAGPRRNIRRAVILSVLTVWAIATVVPASATAAPPLNDNFLQAFAVNADGTALPGDSGASGLTNAEATVQADLLQECASCPVVPEPTTCQRSGFPAVAYNSTVWFALFPHRPGNLTVLAQATGFEPLLGAVQVNRSTAVPDFANTGHCNVGSLGFVQLNYAHRLQEGGAYWVVLARTGAGSPGLYDIEFQFDPDTDRDGLVDSQDQCPNEAGSLNGCPDSDGDGIRNSDDRCPNQSGPAQHRGCPDSDGDGIADPDDRCPQQVGSARHQGCRDSDGDGIPDIDDKCPREDASGRDKNKDGCLDTLLLHRQANVSLDVGGDVFGIVMHSLVVTRVPKGARVSVACKLPAGKRCGGVLVKKATVSDVRAGASGVRARAARTIPVRTLKNKRLPYGTVITIRVTAPKATGKYIRLTVVRTGNRVARVDRCMNRGSKKLRKKGCK
ncbi:MAG: OmpA-OmpF porin, family [Thermoleophilaceae bacterium]|jgi:hypothetical protein|nr:OmpA-OmpF porin, family [Thermoleophilaceae bacterium]